RVADLVGEVLTVPVAGRLLGVGLDLAAGLLDVVHPGLLVVSGWPPDVLLERQCRSVARRSWGGQARLRSACGVRRARDRGTQNGLWRCRQRALGSRRAVTSPGGDEGRRATDPEFLSRVQFALTASFHFLCPPLSMGLGLMMIVIGVDYARATDH